MANLKFIVVGLEEQGLRLDKFLAIYFSNIPYSIIQKKIRLGIFRLNGKKNSPNSKLLHGDKVYYKDNLAVTKKKKESSSLLEKSKYLYQKSLLYEDELILVLNKPYGIPVQGGTKVNFSIDDILNQLNSGEKTFRLTHRLDKNTTGTLIIAKSKEVAKNITQLFREDKIKKTYWAIVIGEPKILKGVINSSIAKVNLNGIEKMKIVENNEKKAITYYKTLETKKGLSLMEVLPITGRTHQIRVHLLSKNCPVLGDKKYKVLKIKENKYYNLNYKMHLHAKSISFELNKKKYCFKAELPGHFIKTLKDIKFKTLINK